MSNVLNMAGLDIADTLNQGCMCRTLDTDQLRQELERDASLQGLAHDIAISQPHLFSNSVVFLSHHTYLEIKASIATIERVMQLPAYKTLALQHAPAIAQTSFGPLGAFMGYDFHVDTLQSPPQGSKLIEINTNAGGAFLNAAVARAHRACCTPMAEAMNSYVNLDTLEQTFFDMFVNEWRLQRGDVPLRTVAIVDDAPDAQYLSPEFELCRQMFEQRGVTAFITDPQKLQWRAGQLWYHGAAGVTAIDLVYNRLTDFDFSAPVHQALRNAYVAGDVVVSPHPHAHALRANKQHLVTLSDDALLKSWGISSDDRANLSNCIPSTQRVTRELADALWAQRKQFFFKPVAGYGSKATYRGDKLTKRVWEEILAGNWGDYIAQEIASVGHRLVNVDGVATDLKFDIRAYTYAGQIQLLAARTYNGQTTNFRTEGGGFSPIVVLPPMAGTLADTLAEHTYNINQPDPDAKPSYCPTPCAC
ncbi:MAG TPA: hypothetical protein PKC80_00995 [Burkholderiaceae bacterium]|nr:hypothetical protein [Burkholderiaceae bacterium]